MFSTFDEHYDFDPFGEDYLINVLDIVPVNINRPHKHRDVRKALDNYSYNVELIGTSDSRRRGSDRIWLVDDKYYVWCSRTGMERAGNNINISSNASDKLVYKIASTVFENVTKRKFGSIKSSELKSVGNLKFSTPRQFIIDSRLDESEKKSYYNDIADLTVELLDKYYDCNNLDELKTIIEWYKNRSKKIRHNYVPRNESNDTN